MNTKSKSILLVGDSCIDKYVYCKCSRLCPEAPVPVLDIKDTIQNRGMAGNVLRNMGVFPSISIKFYTNKNHRSIIKTRYVEQKTNHMFIRIDTDNTPTSFFKDVRDTINYDDYTAVVISDYDKGYITTDDVEYITQRHPLTFMDTKKELGDWANEVSFIKINRFERRDTESTLTDKLKDKIITTLGGGGAVYKNKKYEVEDVEVKDVSGAGDSFLSALVISYIKTNDIDQSIEYANKCASYVVTRKGVSIIDVTVIDNE